nr:enoyl-CoA hydratase-related protein [Pseudofrankia sp. BMG5.37]
MNREVREGIAAALDRLDTAPNIAAAVLTGAGGTFCAGMDLKAFLTEGAPVGGTRGFGGVAARPPDKPLIAAVAGLALAGGFEIALAADLIVAAADAAFGLPEVKRGVIASAGGLVLLGRTLPYQAAMRIALTGERIEAREL